MLWKSPRFQETVFLSSVLQVNVTFCPFSIVACNTDDGKAVSWKRGFLNITDALPNYELEPNTLKVIGNDMSVLGNYTCFTDNDEKNFAVFFKCKLLQSILYLRLAEEVFKSLKLWQNSIYLCTSFKTFVSVSFIIISNVTTCIMTSSSVWRGH